MRTPPVTGKYLGKKAIQQYYYRTSAPIHGDWFLIYSLWLLPRAKAYSFVTVLTENVPSHLPKFRTRRTLLTTKYYPQTNTMLLRSPVCLLIQLHARHAFTCTSFGNQARDTVTLPFSHLPIFCLPCRHVL